MGFPRWASVAVGCLALVMLMLQTEAAVVRYDWNVDYMFAAPDCVEKLILAVNGQYPSPTIRAEEGDTVVVRVTNHIPSEGVVFHWHGMHQSLLIEGRGKYNCSLLPEASTTPALGCLTCNATSPKCAPHVIPVTPGKTYRLRIASVASLSSLNFIMEGHKTTVVQADGRYVKSFDVYNLDVYSGQTYDVLVTADQDTSKNYWAAINVRGRNPRTPTGLAVLQYLPNSATLLPSTPAPVSPIWNDTATSVAQAKKILAKVGYEAAPPKRSDRTLVILGTQNNINGNLKWALNNISYVHKATPVIAALKYKIKGVIDSTPPPDFPVRNYNVFSPPVPTSANYGSPVYVFRKNSVVDVIVQNANTLTANNTEIHPWHLHGHDFWVLGYGEGLYNPDKDAATFNLKDPPVRNTAAVFPYGWLALRFVADNPGAWPFHCHVEPHFHMGMGTVFAEGIRDIPKLPAQSLGCGLTKRSL